MKDLNEALLLIEKQSVDSLNAQHDDIRPIANEEDEDQRMDHDLAERQWELEVRRVRYARVWLWLSTREDEAQESEESAETLTC